MFYLHDPDLARLPVLCLGFSDKEAARKIFGAWRRQFGEQDTNNSLRLVILKGILRTNPAAYRVFITGNLQSESGTGLIVSVGRHQTMTPATSANLEAFLNTFSRTGSYLLAPAHFVSETKPPAIALSLAIRKNDIIVRQAWEIGPNDVDSGAFLPDDDPVIPTEVQNPPVRELLQVLKTMQSDRNIE